MKKNTLLVFNFLTIFTILFVSCGSTKKVAPRTVELFSDVWVDCSKNNNQDCGKFYTSPELGKFDSVEVEFKKSSGNDSSSYGLVFGYSSAKDGLCADYIRFEINTLGEVALYSFDGSKYTDFLNSDSENTAYFVENSSIVKGFDSLNRLKIQKDSEGFYSCFVNGSLVKDKIPSLNNGTNGSMAFFSVGKSDQENLPDNPVKVSYRIVSASR